MKGAYSDQWCERHWEPYRCESPRPNGILASVSLMEAFINLPQFTASVERKKKLYNIAHHEAAQMTLEEQVRIHGKPVCCILGDEVMNRILEDARKHTGDIGHA